MIKEYELFIDEAQTPYLKEVRGYECSEEFLKNPELISEFLRKSFNMDKKAEEEVVMLAMNTKCRPLGAFSVFKGTINSSLFNPRELILRAVLAGAVYIVVAHNHPSGVLDPSKEDIQAAKRIKDAALLMGMDLLDFLIIKEDYYSFKEEDRL